MNKIKQFLRKTTKSFFIFDDIKVSRVTLWIGHYQLCMEGHLNLQSLYLRILELSSCDATDFPNQNLRILVNWFMSFDLTNTQTRINKDINYWVEIWHVTLVYKFRSFIVLERHISFFFNCSKNLFLLFSNYRSFSSISFVFSLNVIPVKSLVIVGLVK